MPVIALDLGGTKLSTALFNNEEEKVVAHSVLLEKREGDEVFELIRQQVQSLLQHAQEKKLVVTSIGICVPGIAYAQTGNVWAPNIKGWDNYPLRDQLLTVFNHEIAVKVDSDRACCILGELWKGNAQGCRDAIFLSVGTGIGAGILANGEVLRGAHDISGAIGWMALNKPFEEKYISCGCFEYNASGEGIAKVAGEWMPGNNITTKDVWTLYDNGDELAKKVIANAVEYWGMAVANLVSLFNPEKIIFGGGVFGPGLQLLDEIYAEAKKWAQPISIQQVRLEGSALGSEAGLYGAGYLALKA